MIKYNEAQSIRKTYEQIVKRLREERVGFDNQLAAIERTLAAKNHDYEELKLLANDANHAKEVKLQELDRVRTQYEITCRQRKRELNDKSEVVRVKLEMQEKLNKREKEKKEIVNKAATDLTVEEEELLTEIRDALQSK